MTHMNDKEALVVAVTDDRIHVRLLQASETDIYSVLPENLAIAQPTPGDRASAIPLELR
jgi:hypothetical protein